VNGNQISTSELPDVDPLNPMMVSQPVWVPIEQISDIELLPHINKNLLHYFNTGIFEPIFFNEPYESK